MDPIAERNLLARGRRPVLSFFSGALSASAYAWAISSLVGRSSTRLTDGVSLYQLSQSNPVNRNDPAGTGSSPTQQPGEARSPGNTPPDFNLGNLAGEQLALLQKIAAKWVVTDAGWSAWPRRYECGEQAATAMGALSTDSTWAPITPKMWAIGTVGGVNSWRMLSHNVVLLTPINGNPLPPMVFDTFHGPQRPRSPKQCLRSTLAQFRKDYPLPENSDSWWQNLASGHGFGYILASH